MTIKVSVITATFNSEKYIKSTYDSIANQTLVDWEWIVTDDCSTDSTYEKLLKIAVLDERVKVEKLSQNSGAAIARNCSMARAKGDYIAFIDSDDLWMSTKLENQIGFMEVNTLHFTFTPYEIITEVGQSIGKIVDLSTANEIDYYGLLKKEVTLGCSTVVLRKWIIDEHQMKDIRSGQDYLFWLDILNLSVPKAIKLPKVLTQYRITPGSVSRNKLKKALRQWQIYREFQNLSFFASLNNFLLYAYRAIFRK